MNIKIIFCISALITLFSCKSTEQIGDYRYKVKIEKANTGDYYGIIESIKTYYLHDKFQAGCIVKSQRLGAMTDTDTIFSAGFTIIDPVLNLLKCYEFHYFGYKNFKDDRLKVFIQEKDGTLKLIEVKSISLEKDRNWENWKSNQ